MITALGPPGALQECGTVEHEQYHTGTVAALGLLVYGP
jgi:hypothetical protein